MVVTQSLRDGLAAAAAWPAPPPLYVFRGCRRSRPSHPAFGSAAPPRSRGWRRGAPVKGGTRLLGSLRPKRLRGRPPPPPRGDHGGGVRCAVGPRDIDGLVFCTYVPPVTSSVDTVGHGMTTVWRIPIGQRHSQATRRNEKRDVVGVAPRRNGAVQQCMYRTIATTMCPSQMCTRMRRAHTRSAHAQKGPPNRNDTSCCCYHLARRRGVGGVAVCPLGSSW